MKPIGIVIHFSWKSTYSILALGPLVGGINGLMKMRLVHMAIVRQSKGKNHSPKAI